MDSFDEKTSKINFDSMHRGLIQSLVGGVPQSQKPSTTVNALYPNQVADNTARILMASP